MKCIFALALITYKEGIRNRALLGIALCALFLFGLNITVAGFFMRDIGKVTVDMNLSALIFAGLLLVFFVGTNLLAKDIDRKTIHLVLSKPISRAQYIWGKYLGILLFVWASLFVLAFCSYGTIFLLKYMYPAYFPGFSWDTYTVAIGFIFLRFAVLISIVIFFSSISTSSLITLIFSIAIYIAGVTIEEVVFYLQSEFAAQEAVISESLKMFIGTVSYLLPNFSAFDFGIEAAHGLTVEISKIALVIGYGLVYSFILLIFASLIFSRREFN